MGPSILIATALIVAIRTAKWAAKSAGDPLISDVDSDLDREVSYAAKITIRVMHELMKNTKVSSQERESRSSTAFTMRILRNSLCGGRLKKRDALRFE